MTLLLGFSAVNTGNNLLYLLVSALLGFMAVSGLLGQQNLNRLQIDMEQPDEVYAGRQTLIRIKIQNPRKRLPGFLLRLEFPDGGALFPIVPAGGELSRTLPLVPIKRGVQRIPPIWVSSRFPINFFIRSRRLPDRPEFLVFPTPQNCRLDIAHGDEKSGSMTDLRTLGTSGELQAISDYHGNEPLKDIHWKLSARHDDLKVKRLSRQGEKPVVIELDSVPGGTLEERLGRCCYLINHLCRNQQPVGLMINGRTIAADTGRQHRLRLLRELAVYDQH